MINTLEILVWVFAAIIFYTYMGYGLVLYVLAGIYGKKASLSKEYPSVSILIAAYNEERVIREKIDNTLSLDYPKNLVQVLLVTDGSTDATNKIASEYPEIELHFHPDRSGKIAALNRVMPDITSDITVFSDANTMLNASSIKNLVQHFEDEKVGVVAGEKRVSSGDKDNAAASGEGIYWRYESLLKSLDSRLYSVVGAAGELYAIRTSLYPNVQPHVIIEDFYISLRIGMEGKVTRYAPEAFAVEKASASIQNELKRKVRIAAGGLQAIILLYPLLNIFRYGWLSFQYISHRVLRWTLAPLGLIILFVGTLILGMYNTFYLWVFMFQVAFYIFALLGWFVSKRNLRIKVLFIPFYFSMMNYAVYAGFFGLLKGKKYHVWDKAERAA